MLRRKLLTLPVLGHSFNCDSVKTAREHCHINIRTCRLRTVHFDQESAEITARPGVGCLGILAQAEKLAESSRVWTPSVILRL